MTGTAGDNGLLNKLVLPLVAVAIAGMVGMQVKLLVDVTALTGQVSTMRERQEMTYSKTDAIADWRVQDQKDIAQNERMNTVGQRILGLDDRITALEKKRSTGRK